KNGSREYLLLSGNSSFVSINIDGRDCCQTGQFSQDVADGALTMLAVSDAAVVGRSVGTSLLVARFGLNTAKEVSLSMQRLEQAGVNIKGAILNGVIKRASTAYSYGYNYYGYSYSEKE
ncbi:TPA: hypothetical protein ACTDYY_001300, partial [Shigella flexneri]